MVHRGDMPLFRKDRKAAEKRTSIKDYYELKEVLGTGAFSKVCPSLALLIQLSSVDVVLLNLLLWHQVHEVGLFLNFKYVKSTMMSIQSLGV
uniref:Protein kinase domain-containing protein n=1 Tax=Syphacia muris TaxID=451379 RepID=A0A0N5AAL9_9BILA